MVCNLLAGRPSRGLLVTSDAQAGIQGRAGTTGLKNVKHHDGDDGKGATSSADIRKNVGVESGHDIRGQPS